MVDQDPPVAAPEPAPAPTTPPVSSVSPTPPDLPSGEPEAEVPPEKKNTRIYVVGIVISIVILVVTGSLFYRRLNQKEDVVAPEPIVEEVVVEEEEEKVEQLERGDITLVILNGTSTTGLAGDTADTFEELGYQISEIGNAEDSEAKNKLYLSEDADEAALEILLSDVKDELDIKKVSDTIEDLDATARIVLGT